MSGATPLRRDANGTGCLRGNDPLECLMAFRGSLLLRAVRLFRVFQAEMAHLLARTGFRVFQDSFELPMEHAPDLGRIPLRTINEVNAWLRVSLLFDAAECVGHQTESLAILSVVLKKGVHVLIGSAQLPPVPPNQALQA